MSTANCDGKGRDWLGWRATIVDWRGFAFLYFLDPRGVSGKRQADWATMNKIPDDRLLK